MICESSFIKSKGVFWWKIVKMSKAVTRKFWEKFNFASFNRLRIPFDWSKRNQEPIDLGRNTMMKFFIVSIDREFLSINRMLFSIDRTGIENRSNKSGFVMNFFIFRSIEKKGRLIEGTKFWIFTCFLIKC